ncbi:MAG: hypothetical protein K2M65_03740, partial [Muribaculaceae bacterium]|nr:hypothetical protein [Muribaculaceae bacterium]
MNMNTNARKNRVSIEFSERLVIAGNNGNDLNFMLDMINKIDHALSFYKEKITFDWLHNFIKDNAAHLLSNPDNRKSMPYNLSIALANLFCAQNRIEDEFRAKEIAIGLI